VAFVEEPSYEGEAHESGSAGDGALAQEPLPEPTAWCILGERDASASLSELLVVVRCGDTSFGRSHVSSTARERITTDAARSFQWGLG